MTTHGRRSTRSASSVAARLLSLTGVMVLGVALALPGSPASASVVPKVDLLSTDLFGVLAASTVTSTGPTVIGSPGDTVGLSLGVSPKEAVTGILPAQVIPPGTIHAGDAVAAQAQLDATTAFTQASEPKADVVGLTDLTDQLLQPGVYDGGELSLTGTVTLDNNDGDPNAVFIFRASSTLITSSGSVVKFTDPTHASCNVFWQVGSSATLGSNSTFVGTIDALESVTANTGATIQGRLLARNAAVTLDSNTITRAPCAVADAPITPPVTTTATTTATVTTTPPTVTTTTTAPTVTTTRTLPPTTTETTTTTATPPTETTTATETTTFIPPPLETTTGNSLTIIAPTTPTTPLSTISPPLETTTGQSLIITTTEQTSTDVSDTTTDASDTTTYYTDTTPYTYDTYTYETGTTEALGIDTGSGGSGASGELASTGVTGVTGLMKSGVLLLVAGVVVLMFAGRRRMQLGRHRHI